METRLTWRILVRQRCVPVRPWGLVLLRPQCRLGMNAAVIDIAMRVAANRLMVSSLSGFVLATISPHLAYPCRGGRRGPEDPTWYRSETIVEAKGPLAKGRAVLALPVKKP